MYRAMVDPGEELDTGEEPDTGEELDNARRSKVSIIMSSAFNFLYVYI